MRGGMLSGRAAAPSMKPGQEMPGGEEHAGDIRHQRFGDVVLGVAGVGQPAAGVQRAGIGDDQVERPAGGGGGADRVLLAGLHGDDGEPAVMRAGQRGQVIGPVRRAAGGGDAVAAGQRLARHFKPDAAVGAGDQDAVGHVSVFRGQLVSGVMTAGSNGVRVKISRSIGSKWLSGRVG